MSHRLWVCHGIFKVCLFLSFPGFLGCGSLKYLYQASRGQLAMINHARPIDEVLRDERAGSRVRALLSEIPAVKRFGEGNGLKPTKNYTEYVDLQRSAAVWVVSASEKLRFKSKTWEFPLVGSFPYLGWFDLQDAKDYADELKKEGWDVDLRGASAFSTLGWFRDPVLSTMIPAGEEALGDLVNVVLHESVHATIYIKGQAYFNESIASFIADRLTVSYLDQSRGGLSPERQAYAKAEAEGDARLAKLHNAYQKLNQIYSSKKPDDEKSSGKSKVLEELKKELGSKRELNNASLIQYRTYHMGQIEFEVLYSKCDRNWQKFLSILGSLAPDSFTTEQQEDLGPAIDPLVKKGC